MLNYFDDADVRVRELPYSLDAQLLNSAATALEDNEQRVLRELRARDTSQVPLNIDSAGVYHALRIPPSVVLPKDGLGHVQAPAVIEGLLPDGVTWQALRKYDDRLPIPQRVTLDSSRSAIPLSSPELFNVLGDGGPVRIGPIPLPLPARIHLWLEQSGDIVPFVSVSVDGLRHPASAWFADRQSQQEKVSQLGDGYFATKFVWEKIDEIRVLNLPQGARLKAYVLGLGMPSVPDLDRPFTHPAYRDVQFPRFWSIDNLRLKEVYWSSQFAGFEYIQSYLASSPLHGVVVEPNTWGLVGVTRNRLQYFDRRERMPERLDRTGITEEPLYGLEVVYEISRPGPNCFVRLQPIPYARASEVTFHRYVVEDPDGRVSILDEQGSFSAYTGTAGWRRGAPKPLVVLLAKTGTYEITLELRDQQESVTRDVFPYPNLALTPVADLELSEIVPEAKGVAFDHRQQPWIWTGSVLVPIRLHSDAYLFDGEHRTIYLTDPYPVVRIP